MASKSSGPTPSGSGVKSTKGFFGGISVWALITGTLAFIFISMLVSTCNKGCGDKRRSREEMERAEQKREVREESYFKIWRINKPGFDSTLVYEGYTPWKGILNGQFRIRPSNGHPIDIAFPGVPHIVRMDGYHPVKFPTWNRGEYTYIRSGKNR